MARAGATAVAVEDNADVFVESSTVTSHPGDIAEAVMVKGIPTLTCFAVYDTTEDLNNGLTTPLEMVRLSSRVEEGWLSTGCGGL